MHRFSRRAAVRTAVLALLAAAAVYGFAALSLLGVLDISETCRLGAGQRYDPSFASQGSLFPLSQPCNGDYDLVPGYVNPTVVVLLILTAAATVVALRARPTTDTPDLRTESSQT